MIVKVLASSSKGNCVWIGNDEVSILIDVGLPKTKIEKIMLERDIDPTKIDAIFLTHDHIDHVKGIAIADKYKIPVYASEGTLKDIGRLDTGHVMKVGSIKGFDALRSTMMLVSPFAVHHDALEPFGYTIRTTDKKATVLMDTGHVDEQMIEAMADSDIYVFECNHDRDMLVDGDYDDFTKSRILSDNGHLSNDQASEALTKLVTGKGEHIYLTHMSANNNLPALAEGTVKRALRAKGLQAGKHYQIEVV
ncbi:MAG: MBL fold metallo-hydrolase [Candidatus Cohnella colombiensis]|uniref:MBL fold metallo-hydrolase n=1 Tax=Candidatus Cohnella colombiensis TaxID=3121368 RepID=A0AA95JF36_9BACL|nr:MAG: MBL fold metallo-hydrolase [Cohnella sp.]